jgi:hypothetical protein
MVGVPLPSTIYWSLKPLEYTWPVKDIFLALQISIA